MSAAGANPTAPVDRKPEPVLPKPIGPGPRLETLCPEADPEVKPSASGRPQASSAATAAAAAAAAEVASEPSSHSMGAMASMPSMTHAQQAWGQQQHDVSAMGYPYQYPYSAYGAACGPADYYYHMGSYDVNSTMEPMAAMQNHANYTPQGAPPQDQPEPSRASGSAQRGSKATQKHYRI